MGKHQESRKSTTIEGKVFTKNTAKSWLLEIKRESASKLNLKLINRITKTVRNPLIERRLFQRVILV